MLALPALANAVADTVLRFPETGVGCLYQWNGTSREYEKLGDTLRHYRERHPAARLFYLIGADHVASLPKWRESIELARLADFVVIPPTRAGFAAVAPSVPRPGTAWVPGGRVFFGHSGSNPSEAVDSRARPGRRSRGHP